MASALDDVRPYMILMGRGQGKTSYVECVVTYAMATGRRKFPVVVSANLRSAQNILNDIFRIFIEPDTPFSEDYPDLCLPFTLQKGSYRRKQTYRGQSTEIGKNAGQFQTARLDGNEGCVFATRGISGGIRGLKWHTLRPDLCILDDLQTAESAENPEQIQKLLSTIKKDIMQLAGKGKLAIL